jgi:hypothetical protein
MNKDSQQLNFLIKSMAQQHQPELPSAGLIWWRAQVQRKLAEKERIERPTVVMGMVALVVCLAVLIAVVMWGTQQTRTFGGREVDPILLLGAFVAAALAWAGSWLVRKSVRES